MLFGVLLANDPALAQLKLDPVTPSVSSPLLCVPQGKDVKLIQTTLRCLQSCQCLCCSMRRHWSISGIAVSTLIPWAMRACSLLCLMSIQKPAFASRSHTDELSEFLQQCKDVPSLDLFSGEGSMDVAAALVRVCLSVCLSLVNLSVRGFDCDSLCYRE